MIKMVVSDMDGTLLSSNLEVTPENLNAIKALRDKGIRFTIATGRPDQLLKEYIDTLQLDEPMIMYNGSVIGHPFKQEQLLSLCLNNNDVREIVEYCEEKDIIYMIYTKDAIYSKPNYRSQFFLDRNNSLEPIKRANFKEIKDINIILNNEVIHKVLMIEQNPKRYKELKKEVLKFPQYEVFSSQTEFIDINPKNASKGNALKVLLDYYGYQLDEVVVFGDQENDISMLEAAGVSVAMGNASDNAKKAADFVTKNNNESGFAVWINENLLK